MNLFHKSKNAPVPGDVSSDNMNGALPNGGEKPKKPLFTFTKKKEEPASVSSDTLDVDGEKKGENTTERPLIKYRYVVINAMGKKEMVLLKQKTKLKFVTFCYHKIMK